MVRLDEVATVQGGIQKQAKRRPVDNRYPFLRVANVLRGRLALGEVHEVELFDGELDRYRLQEGDLLVVEGNGSPDQIGRAAIWDGSIANCVHQNHLIRVRPSNKILPKYLQFAWNAPETAHYLRSVAGSTSGLYTLSTTKLKSVSIPLCSIDEQRRIIDVLDDHLSRLDAAQDSLARATTRLSALWRASLSQTINDPGRSRIPLEELVKGLEAGRSYGTSAPPAADGQWGIIKVSAMTWGEFRPDENKAVAATHVDARYEIRSGDLLVSRANTAAYVGAPVLVGKTRQRLLLSDKSLRLLPLEHVNIRWLWLALSSPEARSEISALATGTKDSMRNISQSNLLTVSLPNISETEQDQDVATLSIQKAAIDRLMATIQAARHKNTALKGSVLTAAFTGRLTGRSTDTEIIEGLASG